METRIEPVTFFKETATVLKINCVKINSFGEQGSALLICSLLAEDGRTLSSQVVEIAGDEYSQWGSDDNYILVKAVEKLGVTAIS